MVELGDEAKCKVTGFQGVVTQLTKCLTGCDRATVQPPVGKDGKHPDALSFDRDALVIVKKGKVKPASVQGPIPGGPPTRVVRR